MTVLTESRTLGAVHAAEELLSQRAGSAVTLDDPEDLGGSGRTTVVRVRVANNPLSMARSLVIKALPADEEPHAFHREVASYKYATALPNESRPGPQMIASDADARVLVLSDLGHGRSMSEILTGRDMSEIMRSVSAWGQALGRLHAATFGGENDFLALLRLGPVGNDGQNVLRDQAVRGVEVFGSIAGRLGVPVSEHVGELLDESCRLFDEGEHRAFSTSDVGPENILLNDEGVQFMDYEWGGFRDATLDIGYALVTCGTRIADVDPAHRQDIETAMVDAWRSEVRAIWPSVSRDRAFVRSVLGARLLWVWLSTIWMLPRDGQNADGQSESDPDLQQDGGVGGHLHDLALYSNDPRVIVARWADLSAAAESLGDTDLADVSARLGRALSRDWLD